MLVMKGEMYGADAQKGGAFPFVGDLNWNADEPADLNEKGGYDGEKGGTFPFIGE